MNIIYTIKFGDEDIRLTKEIEAAIRKAAKWAEEETGCDITDSLYEVAGNNDWCLYTVAERLERAHGEAVDDYAYDYDEANEIITEAVWAEAQNYVYQ